MQLRKFDERSYGITEIKELFLVGLISVIVAGSLGFGFFAILKGNQQVVATLSAQARQQSAQVNSGIIATITKKQPILADSLSQNTNNLWDEDTHCVFRGGSYHVLVSGLNQSYGCGLNTRIFSNAAIQVEMSLLSGEEAGLLFRLEAGPKYYYYGLDQQKQIFFCEYNLSLICPLSPKTLPSIPIRQRNVLLVLAQGNTFTLYMNGVSVGQFQDSLSTSSSGIIGFHVGTDASTQSGDASFTNLKIYQA
jgi:hypothetical protein